MEKSEYYQAKIERYNHDKDYTHEAEMAILIEAQEMNLTSILSPKIYIDGNQWCVLYGDNIQDGICGFGETPKLAIYDLNKSFNTTIKA